MPAAIPKPPSPSHPALTPQMRSVLERIQKAGRPPMHTLGAEQARAAYELGAEVLEEKKHLLTRVENFAIPSRDGTQLPARLYAPNQHVLPVLLYFHGGGFTVGSIATHDGLCRALSALSGCAVVSLDYRLAPEHRFPVAVADAEDAMLWLARHGGAALALDTTRLAVGGDSAGGTLAAVCALLARDAALPLALQLLIYPGCTDHQNTASHQRFADGLLLEQTQIAWFFDQYIALQDRSDWRFAPLNAPDHEGLAPAWLGLAEYDPLVDEGIAYADTLRAAGVVVDIEIYRGVTHEFIKMGRALPEASIARQHAANALRAALTPETLP